MLVCKTIIGRMSGNGGAIARNPISHTNALIRARYDCTLRALLDIQTQHGTPLNVIEGCGVKRIVRTLNARIMTAYQLAHATVLSDFIKESFHKGDENSMSSLPNFGSKAFTI